MNKPAKIASFFVIFLVTVAMGYIAFAGVGENKTGSIYDIKQGLDLAGGVSITYEVVGDEDPTPEDLNDTVFKLQQKVDTYSTEAQVYPEGGNRINIEIPGVNNANEILEELGKPGSLLFIAQTDSNGNLNYELHRTADGLQVWHDEKWHTFVVYPDGTEEGMLVAYDVETDSAVLDENGNPVLFELREDATVSKQFRLLKTIEELQADGSIILTGNEIETAKAIQQQNEQGTATMNVVSLAFNEEGTQKFAEATQRACNKETIAIYYDGKFVSVPYVEKVINNGRAVVTGMADSKEAERVASNIRNGALKLELQTLRSNVVGAQLGSEAISTCLKAAVIGFILVSVFMIAVYFLPGFASVLALVLYVFLMIVTLSLFNGQITLTLPGIAGIILSIGMAVDANVIIFARIREELATGKTVQSAVDIGFKKATSSILDGNITTLIASVVLIIMGTGTVKGFAWTLAIGIILSMFTAMVITRLLLNGFIAMGLDNLKLFGIGKERKTIDFLSKGKVFMAVSLGCIILGGVFMGIHQGTSGAALNWSLEFQGGSSTSLMLAEDMTIEEIDATIVPDIEKITGDGNVQIQKIEGGNGIIIKTRELNDEERKELETLFVKDHGVDAGSIQSQRIGATISNEIKRDSIIAVSVAVVFMLIYIWIRFSDWRFGLSSVLALLHDVLVVLAFYAIVRVSVGSTFIACMLTIVGYSINATIVIFDRIRENYKEAKVKAKESALKKRQRSSEKYTMDLKEIINRSITQTISRSLFTSFTTFIMVAVLFILGVTSIKEFALPLMAGIICGTYSSICIAGSLWYLLRNKFPVRVDDEDDDI